MGCRRADGGVEGANAEGRQEEVEKVGGRWQSTKQPWEDAFYCLILLLNREEGQSHIRYVCVCVCVKMILLLFLPERFCDCFRRIKAVVAGLSSVRRQKCERPPGCFLLAFSLFNASCLDSLWIKTPKNVPLGRRYISRPN